MSQSEETASDLEHAPSLTSRARDELPLFRRLAPRAPPPQSAYDPALLAFRHRRGLTFDGRCDVCFSRTCSLLSHQFYTQSRRGLLGYTPQRLAGTRLHAFSSSYAAIVSTWFMDDQSSRTTWSYNLPLSGELNQVEMKKLFRNWFVVQAPNFLTVPRPIEIVNELLHSPFLLPAMMDDLLCHSVLAVSATMQMDLPDSDRRVLALTLFARAMTLLRQRTTPSVSRLDSNVVAAAIYLLQANLSLADEDGLNGHAASIQALVDAHGGIENLGMCGAVANLLRWTDILYCIHVPQQRCRYLILGTTMAFNDISSDHGTYWKDGSSRVPVLDQSVIQACQDCNRLIAFMHTDEAAATEPVVYSYLCEKVCQLFQQSSEPRAQYFQSATVEECTILTIDLLKVLMFLGGWENPNRPDVKRLCSGIVDAVRNTQSASYWQGYTDLFIWMMFVVRAAEHDSVSQEWCKQILRKVLESRAEHYGGWTAEYRQSLTHTLISFGWSETALLNSIESIHRRLYE